MYPIIYPSIHQSFSHPFLAFAYKSIPPFSFDPLTFTWILAFDIYVPSYVLIPQETQLLICLKHTTHKWAKVNTYIRIYRNNYDVYKIA